MPLNVFADDWRECLRAHYMHVIRTRDKVTEPSLTVVMRNAGFNETELAELRVLATAHVDDVPADFVTDLDILNSPTAEPHLVAVAIDLAPTVEAAVVELEPVVGEPSVDVMPAELLPVELEQAEAEEAYLEPEIEDEVVAEVPPLEPEPEAPDDDEPQQLSLF